MSKNRLKTNSKSKPKRDLFLMPKRRFFERPPYIKQSPFFRVWDIRKNDGKYIQNGSTNAFQNEVTFALENEAAKVLQRGGSCSENGSQKGTQNPLKTSPKGDPKLVSKKIHTQDGRTAHGGACFPNVPGTPGCVYPHVACWPTSVFAPQPFHLLFLHLT